MAKFSWNVIYNRRRKLADEIAAKLKFDVSLQLRGGIKEHFYDILPHHSHLNMVSQFIADKPMWEIPFYMIAKIITEKTNGNHVIDHAWWLKANTIGRKEVSHTLEPWGFVTEPYISEDTINIISQLDFEQWGVNIEILSKEKSTWLPNNTTPIVVTIISGCLDEFLKFGVGSALSLIRCPFQPQLLARRN